MASPDGQQDSVTIHQDAKMFLASLLPNESINYKIQSRRYVWLQLIKGEITLGNESLSAGDGAAISDQTSLEIIAKQQPAEFLLMDLR